MKDVPCPMCGATRQKFLETLKVSDIVKLYKKEFDYDCSYLFDVIGIKGGGKDNIIYYECLNCGLYHFHPIITADEGLYKKLQSLHVWYYPDEKEEYKIAQQFLLNRIKTPINLLEVGSGKGAFKSYLKQDNCYVGLEFSIEAICLAKKNNIVLFPEMIEKHSRNHPNSYDIVCSFQVLEHVANPKSFIESCLIALKPNGILIIAVPSEESFMRTEVNNAYNMPPHHVTRYSDITLKNIASLFNIELLSIEHEIIPDHHLFNATFSKLQRLFLKLQILDLSLKRIWIGYLCKIIIKLMRIIKVLRIINKKTDNGHTAVAFYKKLMEH